MNLHKIRCFLHRDEQLVPPNFSNQIFVQNPAQFCVNLLKYTWNGYANGSASSPLIILLSLLIPSSLNFTLQSSPLALATAKKQTINKYFIFLLFLSWQTYKQLNVILNCQLFYRYYDFELLSDILIVLWPF